MKLKKINAALGLLSILCMLIHLGYTIFSYLTFYYNPTLRNMTAYPFMVLVCLHAVFGMMTVFTNSDGTRLDLYPKQNLATILQRLTAALIFPLLIIHIKTNSLLIAVNGQILIVLLLFIAELLFFAVVITHVVLSLTKGLVTLGLLTSREKQKNLDKVLRVLGAVAFAAAAIIVIKTQIALFVVG